MIGDIQEALGRTLDAVLQTDEALVTYRALIETAERRAERAVHRHSGSDGKER
jgi:hypothetical protein